MKIRNIVIPIILLVQVTGCGNVFSKKSNYLNIITPTAQDTFGLNERIRNWEQTGRKLDSAEIDTEYVNRFISNPIIRGLGRFDYILDIKNLSTPDTSFIQVKIKGGYDVYLARQEIDSMVRQKVLLELPDNLQQDPMVIIEK